VSEVPEYAATPRVEAAPAGFTGCCSDERDSAVGLPNPGRQHEEEKLAADSGDKWDSGKVASEQSVNAAMEAARWRVVSGAI
jgi:hypothetical protein